tara:strand:+ start:87 stop:1331 length:1245 start_codon:yes stop_codon:yes gene_type:complete
MAKDITGPVQFNKNQRKLFKEILARVIEAYATDFKGIDDIKPTKIIAPGIIDRFGRLPEEVKEKIGLPTGYEGPKGANMVSFVEGFEQLGLTKNNPLKIGGGKSINNYKFTPFMDDIIKTVKDNLNPDIDTKKQILEVLDRVLPDLESTLSPPEVKQKKLVEPSTKAGRVTKAIALENQTKKDLAEALTPIEGSEFERTVTPELQKRGLLPAPEALEPELEAEKPPMTVQEIMDERDRIAKETIDANKEQGLKATGERIANMPFKVAEEKPGYIKAFIDTFRNRGAKSILLGAIGGGAGLVLDAALNAADASPTGFSWDNMPTSQIEGLVKSYEGGGPTAEERLSIAEYPPKSPEELRKMLAERKEPIEQGLEMQKDLQRTENLMGLNLKKQPTLQEQMKNLMPQQQQPQGTAQ